MNKFLLDTNIWIDYLNKRAESLDLVWKLSREGDIFSSILTITELRAGWIDEKASAYLPVFYSQTKILGLSREVAELAGKFLKNYKIKGISLPTVDTLIGSTAIVQGCELVTGNKKDFHMPE